MEIYADFDAGGGHVALYDRALMAKSLGSAHAERTAGVDTIALIFAVDDVDAAYRHLSAQGCEFVGKPVDAWNGAFARRTSGIRTAI